METYIEKSAMLKDTQNANKLIGLRVLSVAGHKLGYITQVHLNKLTSAFEGIIIARGGFRKPFYVCKYYIDKITSDAAILNIEPALVNIGKKVVSADGKVFGEVLNVNRINQTNKISSLLVQRTFFRKATIPFSHIKKLGNSIVIKKSHKEAKHGY